MIKFVQLVVSGVTWDLGGNVWQWVRDLQGDLGTLAAATESEPWVDYSAAAFTSTEHLVFGNFGSPFSSATNGGRFGGGTGGAVGRGGAWSGGPNAGAFAASLSGVPADAVTYVGFRCSLAVSESP